MGIRSEGRDSVCFKAEKGEQHLVAGGRKEWVSILMPLMPMPL